SSLHETAKFFMQPAPMPVPNSFFAVNPAAWESLPDDLKAILKQATISNSLNYLARGMNEDAQALEKMKAAGVTVTTIPADEWERMQAVASTIWQEYEAGDEYAQRGVGLLNEFLTKLGRPVVSIEQSSD